jgi:hypothetical protein
VREDSVDLQKKKKKKFKNKAGSSRSAGYYFVGGRHSDDHVGTDDGDDSDGDGGDAGGGEGGGASESRAAGLLRRISARNEASYDDMHAQMMQFFKAGDFAQAKVIATQIADSNLTDDQASDVSMVMRYGEK